MYIDNGVPRLTGFGEDPQPQYGEAGFDASAWEPQALDPDATWDWTAAPSGTLYSEGGGAIGSGTSSAGSSSNFWGGLLTPILNTGLQIGNAYAKQNLLAASTYVVNPKTGQIAMDATGRPILANSTEGAKIATALQKAGVTSPSWLVPVAIGVGVLALGLLVMKKRR